MGVAPLESMSGLPPVTVGAGGRRVALTGLRGGAVTMLEKPVPVTVGDTVVTRTSSKSAEYVAA